MPAPTEKQLTQRRNRERVRQVRGLLLLAFAVLVFIILRAGVHNVFTPAGWWRLW